MELGFISVLPAILAVILAVTTRNVLLSLGAAVFVGCGIVEWGDNRSLMAPVHGVVHALNLVWDSVSSSDNQRVTAFSLLVGATVGVMSKSGATSAMVGKLIRIATTRTKGMLATWIAGLAVFFDDYANCLIVGNGMRPLVDRLGISREKLAYIVDSTAAPIASVALISTWAGYEVSIMAEGLVAAGSDVDPYAFFVAGVGYRFYCLFTIVFVGAIAWTGRDFGPMYTAEVAVITKEAKSEEAEDEEVLGGVAFGAVGPMVLLVVWALGKLWLDGVAAVESKRLAGTLPEGSVGFIDIIGSADGYAAMLSASQASLTLAVVVALSCGALSVRGSVIAAFSGMRQIAGALGVLVLAWTLGSTMSDLGTSEYLVGLLDGAIAPAYLASLVFVVSAATAFATGTSFGTMGIMVPMVIPLSFAISSDPAVHMAASGAVLSGACWGDHCSPISDTTVLSSLGAGCDHVEHVRTQLPYALACGAIALFAGSLPVGFGVPLWMTLFVGSALCILVVRFVGQVPAITNK